MKKSTSAKFLMATAVCLAMSTSVNAAEWEQSLNLSQALTVFVTSNGTILASDQDYDGNGGIFYSTDEGDSWTKTAVADWQYNKFVEAGDFIFAVGEGCRIARSEDDGRTWLVLNYSRTIEDYVSAKEIDYLTAYGLAYDATRQRLYVAVYSDNVGVIYTDDFGVTWQFTDRQSLMVISVTDPDNKNTTKLGFDSFYNLVMYKDKLYAFGLYLGYEYDAMSNRWSVMTTSDGGNFNSNCFSASTIKDDVFYGGRAMENTDGFVYKTTDMTTWTACPTPEGLLSGYLRALDSDENNIYAATLKVGIYYSEDNGQTWKLTGDGFTKNAQYENENEDATTSLANSENYLFCAQFNAYPASMNKTAGIYRIKKSELGEDTSSVNSIQANAPEVHVKADAIVVNAGTEVAEISVVSMAGATLLSTSGNILSTSSLQPGAYVYTVTLPSGIITGKFVK